MLSRNACSRTRASKPNYSLILHTESGAASAPEFTHRGDPIESYGEGGLPQLPAHCARDD